MYSGLPIVNIPATPVRRHFYIPLYEWRVIAPETFRLTGYWQPTRISWERLLDKEARVFLDITSTSEECMQTDQRARHF
jgi:hypothetical protein